MIKNLIKLPVLLVVAFMLLMLSVDLLHIGVSFNYKYQTIISLVILCLGVVVIGISGYSFKKVKTTIDPLNPEQTTYLVTKGIYNFSRNPMYVGFFSWLLACALYIGNPANFLLLPLYIFLVNKLYIGPEERALRKLFNNEFQEYENNVGRWL